MTKTKSGPNFTAVDVGPLTQLDQNKFKHPALPRETDGKVFLNQSLIPGTQDSGNTILNSS